MPFAVCLKGHLRILNGGKRNIDLATPKHTVITDAANEGWGDHFESLALSGR